MTHDHVMSVVSVVLNGQSELCKMHHESCCCCNTLSRLKGNYKLLGSFGFIYFHSFNILSSTDSATPNKVINYSKFPPDYDRGRTCRTCEQENCKEGFGGET